MSHFVVPLDGSTRAASALPVAQGLAALSGATIHVVHVGAASPLDAAANLGVELSEIPGAILHAHGGDPAAAIVRVASEWPDTTIVMSTNGGGLPGDHVLDAIAEQVLATCSCPVVFVHPERGSAPWTLRAALLPHDGTPTSAAAIRPAAELVLAAKARLSVLHVAAPGSPPEEKGTLGMPRYLDQRQHEWPAWAGEFLERLASVGPLESSNLRLHVAYGEPGSEIVRFAAEDAVDLVVLAWHGTLEPERAAAVKLVIRNTRSPVLVLRVAEAAVAVEAPPP